MTSSTTVALGPLSDYLPHEAESLRALVYLHHDRLVDGDVDTHFDLLPDEQAVHLRENFEHSHRTDFASVERHLEIVIRTRLKSVDIDLDDGQLVSRAPELARGQLRPVVLQIIATTDIATLFDLHTRPE
jgi:hypothetical protein